jgi:DNA-binding MarR family transcriptional regulator
MKDHDEVLIALRRIIRATDLYSKHLSKTMGLTAPQLLIMQMLQKRGANTSSAIAREVSLSQATVTSILDRLESRKLIQRVRSAEDKRRIIVSLTAKGRGLIKESPAALQERFSERFQKLPDWEQNLILSALQRVAEMMGAQDIDASPVLDVGAIDRNTEEH